MRFLEIAAPNPPSSHPIMALIEIDRDVWPEFRQHIKTLDRVRLAASCPTARGKVTVYVGCGDDKVRQILEGIWPAGGLAS